MCAFFAAIAIKTKSLADSSTHVNGCLFSVPRSSPAAQRCCSCIMLKRAESSPLVVTPLILLIPLVLLTTSELGTWWAPAEETTNSPFEVVGKGYCRNGPGSWHGTNNGFCITRSECVAACLSKSSCRGFSFVDIDRMGHCLLPNPLEKPLHMSKNPGTAASRCVLYTGTEPVDRSTRVPTTDIKRLHPDLGLDQWPPWVGEMIAEYTCHARMSPRSDQGSSIR